MRETNNVISLGITPKRKVPAIQNTQDIISDKVTSLIDEKEWREEIRRLELFELAKRDNLTWWQMMAMNNTKR